MYVHTLIGLDAAGTSKRAARRFDVDRDGCLYRSSTSTGDGLASDGCTVRDYRL